MHDDDTHMDIEAFRDLVAEVGFSPVPEKFRDLIENVALVVEDEPSEEDRAYVGLADDESLLGLYRGVPLTARGESYGIGGALPDKITIYRVPTLVAAEEDGVSVRQVVEETIWHEVAHHFGLDEDEVTQREDERAHQAE